MSRYYPICLDLKEKRCLIIGGGGVAERKVITLLAYETIVTVISPKITTKIAQLAREGKVIYKDREFGPEDVKGFFLIFAATNNDLINKAIAREANKHNILINVVDAPEDSSFIVPATVKRDDLTISISTGGKSPALAQKIREDMETQYGPEYGILADLLGDFRQEILQKEADIRKRKEIFHHLAKCSELLETIKNRGREAARKRIREFL